MKTVASELASLVGAIANCRKSENYEWAGRHGATIDAILADLMPSGSGWDRGTTLDVAGSTTDRLEFSGSFHHMDEHGGYDGWTDHTIVVRPQFSGVSVRVTGRNRNDIKDYLAEMFAYALECPIELVGDRYVSARVMA